MEPKTQFLENTAELLSQHVSYVEAWRLARQLADMAEKAFKPRTRSVSLAAIAGKWPGNETDEEVAKVLKENS